MTLIQTHITRGNLIESTHKSKCVIKNYNYKTVFSTKNNKDLVYPRSAIKILQAIPFIQSKAKDKYFKKLAIKLAKNRRNLTGLNPSVGCVIVKNNNIISYGQTGIGGRPHAENEAINRCKKNAYNAGNKE